MACTESRACGGQCGGLVAKPGGVLLVSRERCSVGLLRRTRGGLGRTWRVLSPSAERARSLVSGIAVNLPVRERSHSRGDVT